LDIGNAVDMSTTPQTVLTFSYLDSVGFARNDIHVSEVTRVFQYNDFDAVKRFVAGINGPFRDLIPRDELEAFDVLAAKYFIELPYFISRDPYHIVSPQIELRARK
jgi:hypothetical protein